MTRAQVSVTVYFRIFEVLLLVAVIGIVFTEVNNVIGAGVFQKKFLARDLALLMDSLSNARGNLFYTYNPPLQVLEKFEVDLAPNNVRIDDEVWPYAVNREQVLVGETNFRKPGVLSIIKTGNTLTIKATLATEDFNALILDCPSAQVKFNEIIIDPGHGFNLQTNQGDKGFEGALKDAKGNLISESQLVVGVGAALKTHLLSFVNEKAVFSTRALQSLPAEEPKTTKERVEFISKKPGAVVVSLHVGKYSSDQNVLKAFVNKDASDAALRLACVTLNVLARQYAQSITGTAVIPVDLKQLSPDDPKQVLLEGNVGVLFELGNIDYANNKVLENTGKLALAIANGMRQSKEQVFG